MTSKPIALPIFPFQYTDSALVCKKATLKNAILTHCGIKHTDK
jgi:hypothetical protein